jgi:hypothetical protein
MIYKASRLFSQLYALFGGYFWLPCPLCGRMFGGHEIADVGLMTDWNYGKSVCKHCADEASRRNAAYCEAHPYPGLEAAHE